MTSNLMITVLAIAWLGSAATIDISTAAGDPAGVYIAQETTSPPQTGQFPPEAVGAPARGKAQPDKGGEERPAPPPKGDPLKPFEPTEKVKADQAIDFPADI
ncbi:MAG: hypothetical protein ACM3KE_07735 [Hyphomicrobiales bacterium]